MTQRRPAIPQYIKDLVWDREDGICQACKDPIADRSHAEYDHRPALWVRDRRNEFPPTSPRHYVPNANDPAYIDLLHGKASGLKCHDLRTFGNGISRGDVKEAARSKRIIKKRQARTSKEGYALIARGEASPHTDEVSPRRRKRKLPSRPFPKGHRKLQGRPLSKPKAREKEKQC